MDDSVDASHAAKEGQAPYQIAAIFVFLPLCLVALILRIWVRKFMINCFGKDDLMMLLAFISFSIYATALLVVIYVYNNGQTYNWYTLEGAIYWTMVDEVFYLITMIFLKLSLGLFFLRIIPRKGLRRLIYGTMVLTTVVNSYHIFFVIFMCGDPRHYLHNVIQGKCASNAVVLGLAYEQTAITTVTDWIFAILPITILWNAKMDLRTKFVAGFILSLGALGSIASMVRFKYIGGLQVSQDFFTAAAGISIWSTIELGTGIVAGSMATLRPLFKKLFYKAKTITMTIRGRPSSNGKKTISEPKFIMSRGRPREVSATGPHALRGKGSVESTSSRASTAPDRIWDASHHSMRLACVLPAHEAVEGADEPRENVTFEFYAMPDEERGLGVSIREEKRVHLVHVKDDASFHEDGPTMWSQEPGHIQWPFSEHSPERGISKVIDVEVSTSRVEEINEDNIHLVDAARTPDGSPVINLGRFSSVRVPDRSMRTSMHSRKASLQRHSSQFGRKDSPSRGVSWFKSTPSSSNTVPVTAQTPVTVITTPQQVHQTVAPMATPTPSAHVQPQPENQSTPSRWAPGRFFTSSKGSPMKQNPADYNLDNIMTSQSSSIGPSSRGRKRSVDDIMMPATKLEEWDKLPDLILQKSPSRTRSQSPSGWGMFKVRSRQ